MLKLLTAGTSVPTLCVGRCFSVVRGEKSCAVAKPERAPRMSTEAALYVHWPYCLRRCSYCNFNKYIQRSDNNAIMSDCLQRETETLLRLSGVSCVTSVFFGGGTPSLAHPSTVAAVLETVARYADLSDKAEVTLEVNPTPVGKFRLKDFLLAGVNRFSIGVQSLQDNDLKVLGRDHSSQHARQTVAEARRLCPGRVSVDVMIGRPNQSVESLERELGELLSLCDDHLSLYQLTLERGTQLFKQVQQGELSVPTDDVTADMYKCARRILHESGYVQYEVSNFARRDAISLHNMNYWKGHQYIGIGPVISAGFHFPPRCTWTLRSLHGGGVCREARTQTLEPDVWMREVRQKGHGTRRRIPLSHLALLEEVLVMGLRLNAGINHKHWQVFSPAADFHQIFEKSKEVREFQQRGLLILDDSGLRCTWQGLALLDSMLPTLLLELETHITQR